MCHNSIWYNYTAGVEMATGPAALQVPENQKG